MVSVVSAEEVNPTPEVEIPALPSEESMGGNEENSEMAAPSDSGDTGYTDDPMGDLPVDGDSAADPLNPDLTDSTDSTDSTDIEDGGEEEEEFIADYGDLTINADAVYLTSPDDAVVYSVGDVLSGGAFFEVDTDELGSVKIYIPIDYQEGSFAYDNYGNLVNIRAATITGYILDGTQYTVRWTSFGTPQYRLLNYSGVGSTYNDLTVETVEDTNIQIIEDDSEVPLFPDDRYVQLLILLCLGVIVLCQFMKA